MHHPQSKIPSIKALPGRKTDVKDSEWIADLFRHGLLKASFVPPKPIRELRELTRYRKTLIQERAQEINRLQKVLEGANLKLAAVATDVLGKSGRDMLEAVVDGEQDAEVLAELARGKLRAKLPALRQALDGRIQSHHRFLLERILAHIDFLEASIAHIQQQVAQRLGPYEEAMTLRLAYSRHSRGGSSRDHFRNRGEYGALSFRQTPCPPSQGSVRGTNKAAASGSVAQHAWAIPICERCWEKWLGSSPG